MGNESFANAERDIEILTGVRIPHSTQHRLVTNYQLPEPKITKRAEALSVDGGSVRLRTALGQKSEWKNYKGLKVHERVGVAFFQDNESLLHRVNQQSLSRNITCLGDAHDGIWNIIQEIGTSQQRREVLDWYHLKENLYRVGGSIRRLTRVENYLWQGLVTEAIGEFEGLENKKAQNFQEYLRKHQGRIPDYQLDQELGICIGSGSVESWIKQIDSRPRVGVRRKACPRMGRTRESWCENQDYWRTVESKKCASNVKTSVCLFKWRYRPKYLCLVKKWDAPAKEYIAHREFETKEELEKLVKRLLNEGELIINWSRKLKNKGNAVNVI